MNAINQKNINREQELYQEYEELLIRRDQLIKEAGSILIAYTSEFGDMITANFELKMDCIREKKTINYCRRRQNRGLPVDVRTMQAEIEREMHLYKVQLLEMMQQTELAKQAETVDEFRLSRSKKLYRRLAKQLHPDINPETEQNAELKDLWERIVRAYRASNVDELEDLEVLVRGALNKLDIEPGAVQIDDIEDRIDRVERQINDILATEPYTYKEILLDEAKKEEYRRSLQAEHDDYEEYLAGLKQALQEMLTESGCTLVWTTNPGETEQ